MKTQRKTKKIRLRQSLWRDMRERPLVWIWETGSTTTAYWVEGTSPNPKDKWSTAGRRSLCSEAQTDYMMHFYESEAHLFNLAENLICSRDGDKPEESHFTPD